eukprot:m.474064 g.474064  ORF g.474064 m.474064 type:complete len:58 (+) comp21670_c3_seq26:137-310(+)
MVPPCVTTVPSWAAIMISVTFILIFGEVVPQAVQCKERETPVLLSREFVPIPTGMLC